MNPLMPSTLWAALSSPWAVALAYLLAAAAYAEEPSRVEVPPTQNPYIPAAATLYEQAKYEEALSKLEKALEWKSNGTQEVIWLKLMQGVLQAELAQGAALGTFKEALAMDAQAQLPVKGSRRLRRLFEQARNTAGLPTDQEILAEELEPEPGLLGIVWTKLRPPPRPQGVSVGLRGEGDALGLALSPALIPAVSLGYTGKSLGGVLTVLMPKPSLALRAEGRYHPLMLGWVRPYAGLGATAFFMEQNEVGDTTFLGGVGGRVALGADVQLTPRMNVFLDVAYERFLTGAERYKPDSVLLAVGVGWFP